MVIADMAGLPRVRQGVYENAGFWPGLLDDWRPNYRAQPLLMFVTYGFLHGGFWHLLFNMVTLVSLGQGVIDRAGPGGFAAVYAGALLGGGLGYALLSTSLIPMVGASGALFGLAGVLVGWEYLDRRRGGLPLRPVLMVILFLAAMNLVLWVVMNGHLAWETHLGGFIAGALAAPVLRQRR